MLRPAAVEQRFARPRQQVEQPFAQHYPYEQTLIPSESVNQFSPGNGPIFAL